MNPFKLLTLAVQTDSNVSAMRIIVLFGCLLSFVGTAVVWFVPALHAVAVPASSAFGGIATMLLALKIVQNGQENKAP
jgi:hypothetical protein